ncbi:MAG: BlaI/MecI/CopY family transcriptional regulator [Terracidiphilus sp.]
MKQELKKVGLTKLELKIMQVIWRCGSSTVSAVQTELQPSLAYTTVQTMLNILERKGKLKRELDGRAYVYSARVTEEKALGQGVRDLIDRMFGGSSEDLVMSLLKNGQIDAKKLADLTRRFHKEGSKP